MLQSAGVVAAQSLACLLYPLSPARLAPWPLPHPVLADGDIPGRLTMCPQADMAGGGGRGRFKDMQDSGKHCREGKRILLFIDSCWASP